MGTQIEFTIDGEVTAQGRPRAGRRGNKTVMYDPAKSKDYKQYVRLVASQHKPEKPLEGEIELVVVIYKQIPKSMPKWQQELARSGKLRPVTKPDCTNYVKGIEDALNGIIYKDDSQIVKLIIEKKYSDNPRAEITVKEVPKHEKGMQSMRSQGRGLEV